MPPKRENGGPLGQSIASYLSVSVALVLVVLLGLWGAVRDWTNVRTSLIEAELSSLQSHAERTIFRIENQLSEEYANKPEEAKRLDFRAIRTRGDHGEWYWLSEHWKRQMSLLPGRVYSAIVAPDGTIHRHSDRSMRGKKTLLPVQESKWSLPPEIAEIQCPNLTLNRRCLDFHVPIRFNQRVLAYYHAGLDADWVDDRLAVAYRDVVSRWAIVIGGIVVVVLFAAGSLYLIARHTASLRYSLEMADLRRVTEVSQLMVGLAHEIRNPLNALRLNLHMAERVHRQDAWLPDEEVSAMLRESTREVERIRDLMNEMLGYTRSEPIQDEDFDLASEVTETLSLLKHVMEQDQIAVRAHFPSHATLVRMNRTRLRQVLLNLLNNAREAVGPGGQIDVELTPLRNGFEVGIEDNGPGVPADVRDRIFDPFFSTKDQGVGLGLALVRKFVEEAGGDVQCHSDGASGSRFCVRLPQADSSLKTEAIA